MIGWLGTAVLLLLATVLQSTHLHGLGPGGTTPDLVLLIVLAAGRHGGETAGSCAGFWGGLLIGAVRGGLEGPMAVLYVLAGWLAGAHQESSLFEMVLVGCLATVLMVLGETAIIAFLGLAGSLTMAGVVGLALLHGLCLAPLAVRSGN